MRAGVLRNPHSHANRRGGERPPPHTDVLFAEPESAGEVAAAVRQFAEAGVELLVIDGGDGTVREVLTALPVIYGDAPVPLLSLVASGKTNVLAFDLGIREAWTLDAALAAAVRDGSRIRLRSPLHIERADATPLRGFLLGAAGVVKAIDMAQDLHRWGVFKNAAVALTLVGAIAEVVAGREQGAWRGGQPLSLSLDDGPARAGARLATMATTLERLPFALRPFGPSRHGLKVLDIDAPPRRLVRALPRVLWGRDDRWLAAHGYRRADAGRLGLSLAGPVVLDGETYPGGEFTITEGPLLRFLTP